MQSIVAIAAAATLLWCLLMGRTNAQIPSLGGCPAYEPMIDFDRESFMGTWYEVHRYFTVTELAARCISATYERRPDNSLWVNNTITNRL